MGWAFDGANSKLTGTISAVTTDWSCAFWAKVPDTGEGPCRFLDHETAGGGVVQRIDFLSTAADLRASQAAATVTGTAVASSTLLRPPLGDWFMYAAVYTHATRKIAQWIATLHQSPYDPISVITAASGANTAAGTVAVIGNRASQANTVNGTMEDVLFDTTAWDYSQVVAFWEGWRPWAAASVTYYLPLREPCNSATQAPVDMMGGTWTATAMGAGESRPPILRAQRILSLYDWRTAAVANTLTLTGATTPAGAVTKQAQAPKTSSTTPAGAVVKAVAAPKLSSTTPAGTLVKLTTKTFTSSTTPSGAAAVVRAFLLALGGTVTPAGAVVKAVAKALGGSTTPTGAPTKAASKTLTASTTPAGLAVRATTKGLTGAVSAAGAVAKACAKAATSSTSPSGSVVKAAAKVITAATAPAGALRRAVTKALGGLLGLAGGITTQATTTVRTPGPGGRHVEHPVGIHREAAPARHVERAAGLDRERQP